MASYFAVIKNGAAQGANYDGEHGLKSAVSYVEKRIGGADWRERDSREVVNGVFAWVKAPARVTIEEIARGKFSGPVVAEWVGGKRTEGR